MTPYLHWSPSGQSGLSGPLLELADDCDEAFRILARRWAAGEERHGTTLPANALQRVDYLRSFPHQATFPVRLAPDEANLAAFRDEPLERCRPGRAHRHQACHRSAHPGGLLSPFCAHQGQELDAPLYLTTRNTCFRAESYYEPLRRQWAFTMREIVCLGSPETVAAFLVQAREAVGDCWTLSTSPSSGPSPQTRSSSPGATRNT